MTALSRREKAEEGRSTDKSEYEQTAIEYKKRPKDGFGPGYGSADLHVTSVFFGSSAGTEPRLCFHRGVQLLSGRHGEYGA